MDTTVKISFGIMRYAPYRGAMKGGTGYFYSNGLVGPSSSDLTPERMDHYRGEEESYGHVVREFNYSKAGIGLRLMISDEISLTGLQDLFTSEVKRIVEDLDRGRGVVTETDVAHFISGLGEFMCTIVPQCCTEVISSHEITRIIENAMAEILIGTDLNISGIDFNRETGDITVDISKGSVVLHSETFTLPERLRAEITSIEREVIYDLQPEDIEHVTEEIQTFVSRLAPRLKDVIQSILKAFSIAKSFIDSTATSLSAAEISLSKDVKDSLPALADLEERAPSVSP